jgi:hypothetical protein
VSAAGLFADQHTLDVPSVPSRDIGLDIQNVERDQRWSHEISGSQKRHFRQHRRISDPFLADVATELLLPDCNQPLRSGVRKSRLGRHDAHVRRARGTTRQNAERQ